MTGENALTIVRTLDAPRKKVWRACRETEALKHWWGLPTGATMQTCKVDFRVGGAMLCEIDLPDGTKFWFKWIYREIVEGERLVLEQHFSDQNGRELDSPQQPASMIRLGLEDMKGKTRLTVTQTGMVTEVYRLEDFREGWSQSLHRLEEHLANEGNRVDR